MAIALLLSLSAAAQTQQQDTSRTLPLQQLASVEVRAIRAGSDAPFAKTEISKKELQQYNLGQDLPYLLQNTPSVVVSSDAGAGVGYTNLRIRGTDGTRINVTLNGVPVNDAESQGTYFVDLPDLASSASSIQIQRGVGTSTNGAGAFGGTVSISNLGQSDSAEADGSFSLGSFHTRKYTVHAGTGWIRDRFALDLRLSHIASDGYIARSASNLKSLQLLAAWKLSDKTSLRLMILNGQEITQQAWNGVPEDSLNTNRRFNELGLKKDGSHYEGQVDNYRQNYYQLFADHRFQNSLIAHAGLFLTRGIGFYEEYKTDQPFQDYGLPDFITPARDTFPATDLIRRLWLDNYHYGAVFSLIYDRKFLSLTLGGGWSRYEGNHYGDVVWAGFGVPDHFRYYRLDARKTDANLYLKASRALGHGLVLTADLQWRELNYEMNGFRNNPGLRPSVHYRFFNPKAGLTWWLRQEASRSDKAYLSFALANHEPNRDDFEASPNSLPRPERLYDWEGGYEIRRKTWQAGLNLYAMRYKDQLVLTGRINEVGAYTRTNVPSSFRAGLELEGGCQPVAWLKLQGNASFSQNRIGSFTEYLDNYDSTAQSAVQYEHTDIAFSPRYLAAGSVAVRPWLHFAGARELWLELQGRTIGRQYLDNTSRENRSMPAYSLLDVRIRYTLPAIRPFRELSLSLALNNVLDRKYVSNGYTFSYIYDGQLTTQNYYFPQAGFHGLLGLNLSW